jgi:acetoacetyl-CoA reductase/3-oxoacyl-[acyl-carrier protein] reductase
MIIITGASRGIGKYLFWEFADKGEDVIGTYNCTPLSSLKNMYEVDVGVYAHCEAFANRVIEKYGYKKDYEDGLIVINCAGTNYNSMVHKSDPLSWFEVLHVNLLGVYNMSRVFLPKMREDKYGRIINLSSIVAEKGIIGTSAYAASKSGLWGMTRAMTVENAGKGITVNNINLGYFDIGMIRDVPSEHLDKIKESIPCGRLGNPSEIMETVQYIIDCEYLNGVSISLNGGLV